MDNNTPKLGDIYIASTGRVEIVLVTPIQWVVKDLADDHLRIIEQPDFDSLKPAPTEELEVAYDIFKTMWPNDARAQSIGLFLNDLSHSEHSSVRLARAGYRKVPTRQEALQHMHACVESGGRLYDQIHTVAEGRIAREVLDEALNYIYGEQNV